MLKNVMGFNRGTQCTPTKRVIHTGVQVARATGECDIAIGLARFSYCCFTICGD